MDKLIYPYSKDTGEYLGHPLPAQVCVFEGEVIPTVYSSVVPPPEAGPNEIAVMRDANGNVPDDSRGLGWTIVADYRRTTYWLPEDGSRHRIDTLDVSPPINALYEEPPPSQADLNEKRKLEILKELETLDQKKIRALSDAVLLGDTSFLQSVENSQEALRVELRSLPI